MARVRCPADVRSNSLLLSVQTSSCGHPASYPMGKIGSFPGVKWPGHETDHSPPSNAEVKYCSHASTSAYVFMAWCVVKHTDNFTFTVTGYRLFYMAK
jgi:hypothetical protein